MVSRVSRGQDVHGSCPVGKRLVAGSMGGRRTNCSGDSSLLRFGNAERSVAESVLNAVRYRLCEDLAHYRFRRVEDETHERSRTGHDGSTDGYIGVPCIRR